MKHPSREEIVEQCFEQASDLFEGRVEIRRTSDMLWDAYEDATGAGPQLYADKLVKEARDALYELDHAIGNAARLLENLARDVKRGAR